MNECFKVKGTWHEAMDCSVLAEPSEADADIYWTNEYRCRYSIFGTCILCCVHVFSCMRSSKTRFSIPYKKAAFMGF